MRKYRLSLGMLFLGVCAAGCSTMTTGSLVLGDGTAYVTGATQSLTWTPMVWKCPVVAGQGKCTPVAISGVE